MSYTVCHTPYVIHRMSYTVCHTPYVIHRMSYTVCHTPYVIHRMSYTVCHTPYVIHRMSYTVCHTPYGIHRMAYTVCHTPYVMTSMISQNYTTRPFRKYVFKLAGVKNDGGFNSDFIAWIIFRTTSSQEKSTFDEIVTIVFRLSTSKI